MEDNSLFLLGVFDLLHKGHIQLIEKASQLGYLKVGVVRDAAIKKQKGNDRPIINQDDRWYMVSRLKGVGECFLIDDFEIPKFELENCKFIVIGEDQSHIKNLNKIPFMKKIILPRTEGVSTGSLLDMIKG